MTLTTDRPPASGDLEPTNPPQSEPPGVPMSPRNQKKAHSLGLTSATGLVVGSIVGTGVFTMPAVLAGAGTMGILVLAVIAVGAMLLAVLFGQLTKRVPNSDGGLYAARRQRLGETAEPKDFTAEVPAAELAGSE
jgi:APA family basic amino acid/polyamine antiporter